MSSTATSPGSQVNGQSVQVFALFPALAAGGLALLYAAGAVSKATQLHGADLPVRDFLPMVPIPSLLAVGIGVLIRGAVGMLFWGAVVGVILWLERRHESRTVVQVFGRPVPKRRPRPQPGWIRRVIQLVFGTPFLWVGLFLIYCLTWPIFTAASFAASAWLGSTYLPWLDVHRYRRAVAVIVAGYVAVISLGLANSFFNPTPLPIATIKTTSGETRVGALVTQGDGAWYIAQGKHQVVAVPTSRMAFANISSRKPPRPKSAWASLNDLMR